MRDIIELPHDLFLIIIGYLSPRTCVRCRAVSRGWHSAFTSEVVALLLLRWNFPRCRELRLAAAASSASAETASSVASIPAPPTAALPRNVVAEVREVAETPHSWSSTFAEVARRYHHLTSGRPRLLEKLDVAESSRDGEPLFSFWGVAPWSRFLRLNEKTCSFHYPDPVWWYSQEDGVLVYPAAVHDSAGPGHVYQVMDLSTRRQFPVPFDVRSKHIRRARLAQGVLVFEWAEALPYHQLNDREVVHRHFVTAFDVVREPSGLASGPTWTVQFRSEWKLHFLGLPLNRSDRFFSAHTATHYAVYFWQPNRSLYQDDPIEQLAVWDISSPSPYRPSLDPRGDKRPIVARAPSLPTGLWSGQNGAPVDRIYGLADSGTEPARPRRASLAAATAGPQVIRRMAWRELDFYGLRQRATPQLRALALDDHNLYVIEEEHRWADGQHSSLSPPRVHQVKSTGIPIVPAPTCSPQTTYAAAALSASGLSAAVSPLVDTKPVALSTIVDGPVNGPIWVDACGADGDVHMNFCRRVIDARGIGVGAVSTADGVPLASVANSRNTVSQERLGEPSWTASSAMRGSSLRTTDPEYATSPAVASQITRWPGWAPCWRHEDFPYLTVAEMVDFAAGVRVTARHCFMLETLSVHVRPAVAVKGVPSARAPQDSGSTLDNKRRSRSGQVVSARSQEVHFPDEMWSELLAKGHIAGDERWIVGEDRGGRITIARFREPLAFAASETD